MLCSALPTCLAPWKRLSPRSQSVSQSNQLGIINKQVSYLCCELIFFGLFLSSGSSGQKIRTTGTFCLVLCRRRCMPTRMRACAVHNSCHVLKNLQLIRPAAPPSDSFENYWRQRLFLFLATRWRTQSFKLLSPLPGLKGQLLKLSFSFFSYLRRTDGRTDKPESVKMK